MYTHNYFMMCTTVTTVRHTLLWLPSSVGSRISVMLTNLWKKHSVISKLSVKQMACNSLFQNGSKYLEAVSEFLFRISGLHFSAHHGNVVALWGHVVGKWHAGYIDIWRFKLSIALAGIIILLSLSHCHKRHRLCVFVGHTYWPHLHVVLLSVAWPCMHTCR